MKWIKICILHEDFPVRILVNQYNNKKNKKLTGFNLETCVVITKKDKVTVKQCYVEKITKFDKG